MELWGGRFREAPNELAARFGASIDVDRRLYRQDIVGSMAHCRMLARQGIIDRSSAVTILDGLTAILAEIERGEFEFRVDREDVHANVEGRLRDIAGDVAGRLHTARSRNDQVALDTRLWSREAILDLVRGLVAFADALLDQAQSNMGVAMPGYTHLQRAQPVLLTHHLLAYVEMVRRDVDRLRDAYRRVDVSPLGAGALAGLPYPIDREAVARDLGFEAISRNSLDAVSDRDYVVEIVAACALGMVHLSRYCEEIILWSSTEFGFISLSDAFSTGSSIMPQKKNPDTAELIRGKAGRAIGSLTGLLVMLKGTPLAYNKDFQEDKSALFDAVDTFGASLAVLAPMTRSATFKRDRLIAAASENFSLATDYADFLAQRGVPFRRAHEVIGRLVARCLEQGCTLDSLSLDELRAFAPEFTSDALNIQIWSAIDARDVPGGTATGRVSAALIEARDAIRDVSVWIDEMAGRLPAAEGRLASDI
ncbi:MAG: argininosuccinate lyase [Chloroflexota bacterium]|nr:MAG: argininosuccinate lyase [Chloroflexota bacterium]